MFRTKILAMLIGPAGMGLFGAYSSLTTLISSIAGMGINTSGVRQIAEATATNDSEQIARTVTILRRTSLILGLVGAVVLAAFSAPLAHMTFGTGRNWPALVLLSVTVLFAQVAAGQTALIQGMRRIRDLAAMSVWGALWGTCVSIPLVYFLKEKGVVPFLVSISALGIFTSWWYARKISVARVVVPPSAMLAEVRALLRMGLVFMASGLMVSGVAYLTRVLIIREMGLHAAGLYQAAYTLSGVYVGFILSAMGADYYPRLTAVATNDREVNRLVNEQTEAAILMALPGILITLLAAPLVIRALYSPEFALASEILKWQLIGIFGRIVSWPMAFVLVAKGKAQTFFWTELIANSLQLGATWVAMRLFGVVGLGLGFCFMYLFYCPMMFVLVNRETGFRWTLSNAKLVATALAALLGVLLCARYRDFSYWAYAVAIAIAAAAAVMSCKMLLSRVGGGQTLFAWIRLRVARAVA